LSDASRLPPLDVRLTEGDVVRVGKSVARVVSVNGHTIGHVAYIFDKEKAAFTGDSLMVMGCGRLFEGTPEQMWDSLQKFMILPDDMLIYSGHEYAKTNAAFALMIDPKNPALLKRASEIAAVRAKGGFTVPSTMGLEKETNPFLRAHFFDIKSEVGMLTEPDATVFAEIRARRDWF